MRLPTIIFFWKRVPERENNEKKGKIFKKKFAIGGIGDTFSFCQSLTGSKVANLGLKNLP